MPFSRCAIDPTALMPSRRYTLFEPRLGIDKQLLRDQPAGYANVMQKKKHSMITRSDVHALLLDENDARALREDFDGCAEATEPTSDDDNGPLASGGLSCGRIMLVHTAVAVNA